MGKWILNPSLIGRKNVDDFLDYMNTPAHKKVKLVALKLKSGASALWDQLEINRRHYGKHPIRTWEKMKNLCVKDFSLLTMSKSNIINTILVDKALDLSWIILKNSIDWVQETILEKMNIIK